MRIHQVALAGAALLAVGCNSILGIGPHGFEPSGSAGANGRGGAAGSVAHPSGGSGGTAGTGDVAGTAGTIGSGGSGGAKGNGGSPGSGGASSSGGTPGTGGVATGGTPGTGGTATGGTPGTGGAGSGGKAGSGGTPGTGGVATGGTPGTGGVATGGTPGTGGVATGGTPGTGGTATGGTPGTGGAASIVTPCDILNAAGNTCVAAHSTVRVVYPGYTGPLYQICKGSSGSGPSSCASGTTMDIGSVTGGYANAAAQDAFCPSGSTCTISIIYDQSPNKNDLEPAPGGGNKASADIPATATDLRTTLGGHEVYGILIKPGMGYRAGCTGCGVATAKGTATGDQPETEYMVTSQLNLIDGCCFDYGNAEKDAQDDGNGNAEAVYFGGGVVWGTGSPGGHNNGPWVMADLENGLFAGWSSATMDQNITTNTPLKLNFVTAVVVGDTATQNVNMGRFALYGADATTGTLKTLYDGIRPAKPGYLPMHKQGSIVLGIAGDNSAGGAGEWFEGVMASGAATVTTLNSLQANIVGVRYGN